MRLGSIDLFHIVFLNCCVLVLKAQEWQVFTAGGTFFWRLLLMLHWLLLLGFFILSKGVFVNGIMSSRWSPRRRRRRRRFSMAVTHVLLSGNFDHFM